MNKLYTRLTCTCTCTCEKQPTEGDANALGLSTHLGKPNFIATLLLLSDILSLLGNLSRSFQVSTLNLLHIKDHVAHTIKALNSLKANIYSGSYTCVCPLLKQHMNLLKLPPLIHVWMAYKESQINTLLH